MEVLKQPLSNVQLELLKTFSHQLSKSEILELRKILAQFFAQRAIQLYPARPHQLIFNLLFSPPASLRSLADAQASSTFRASQAEKIAASKFHLL